MQPLKPNRWGQTALHRAASSGNGSSVAELLESVSEQEIGYQDQVGRTALHCAVESGRGEMVRLLLESPHAQNLFVPDLSGDTPIHLAAKAYSPEPLKVFASTKGLKTSDLWITPNEYGQLPLHIVALCGDSARAELLLQMPRKWAVDGLGRTPLHLAASMGNAGIVRLFLEHFGEPSQVWIVDQLGRMPLHCAAASGNVELIRAFTSHSSWESPLSERAYDKDLLQRSLFHWAVLEGTPEATQEVLALAKDLNQMVKHSWQELDRTTSIPMHSIAIRQDREKLRVCLDSDASWGFTASFVQADPVAGIYPMEQFSTEQLQLIVDHPQTPDPVKLLARTYLAWKGNDEEGAQQIWVPILEDQQSSQLLYGFHDPKLVKFLKSSLLDQTKKFLVDHWQAVPTQARMEMVEILPTDAILTTIGSLSKEEREKWLHCHIYPEHGKVIEADRLVENVAQIVMGTPKMDEDSQEALRLMLFLIPDLSLCIMASEPSLDTCLSSAYPLFTSRQRKVIDITKAAFKGRKR